MKIEIDAQRVADIREAAGWDAPSLNNLDRKMLLCVSEICEAQGELRDGHQPQDIYYKLELGHWCVAHHDKHCIICPIGPDTEGLWEHFENRKPEGFGVEVADAILRLVDIAFSLGIPLQQCLDEKIAFNATRPRHHGGRKF